MRSRTPKLIRILRYSLLGLSLLFAGGIAYLGISDMSKAEADPLADYRSVDVAN